MTHFIHCGKLAIHPLLYQFVNEEAIPGSELEPEQFWRGFEALLQTFMPRNKALLAKRVELQNQLRDYAVAHPGIPDPNHYRQFLREIGYLEPVPEPFTVSTAKVDRELTSTAGPQLVVPINNARYVLNAVNARWGSLYDALYGTDVLAEASNLQRDYDPQRGAAVIAYGRRWLDKTFPLQHGSHKDAQGYTVSEQQLQLVMADNSRDYLQDRKQFIGFRGSPTAPTAILLRHNGLHAEIQIDHQHPVGKSDGAKVKDIVIEAALSTIVDCEDSVAAVDAADKVRVYQNWLGLMQGTLRVAMRKHGKALTRTLHADREYTRPEGGDLTLPGRSVMLVRNVGHLMTSSAILLDGEEIPEGIMDGVITSLIAKHDIVGNSPLPNSRTGSIYIVKPKMHGSAEVAFSTQLLAATETLLGLPKHTIKIGIMDEERRTSLNLAACIEAAKERVVFINTGFLDRTGDEIHTSMAHGVFAAKTALKQYPWLTAYERANVATGLATGLAGKAQIGKGMWPEPDNMAAMMQAKIAHPQAGASTAWVPSPTAATLHALHYFEVDVSHRQRHLLPQSFDGIDSMLEIPLLANNTLSPEAIQRELDNNVQGILGYVVRWVHQGIGCSKVPDINQVGLMEDRATLRISSQHLANWLYHGVITEAQVQASLQKMAALVDIQNSSDSEYIPMLPESHNSLAFQAASELIFKGAEQPNGYTEPVLHQKRRQMKSMLAQNANPRR